MLDAVCSVFIVPEVACKKIPLRLNFAVLTWKEVASQKARQLWSFVSEALALEKVSQNHPPDFKQSEYFGSTFECLVKL